MGHSFLSTRLISIPFLVSLLAFESAHGAAFKTGSCEDTEFSDTTWLQLTEQEPRLMKELNFIANASGQTGTDVKVTNCRVEWPVDENGKAIPGFRTGVIHKVWYDSQGRRNEAGMRMVWLTEYEETQVGSTYYKTIRRNLYGFTICHSEPVCGALNVLGLKEPTNPTTLSLK